MVKRAGERVRPTTPTGIYGTQQQYGHSSTDSPVSAARLSPEPKGKLDIAIWAAAAAEALSHSSTAGSAAGQPYQPAQQQGHQSPLPRPHPGPQSHPMQRCTDGSGYNASSSPQHQQQQHLQKLMFLQQQQQQLMQAAGSPIARRPGSAASNTNSAAAAAAGGHSRPNNSGMPGQRPAGPFSPLFSGGGMWSSQGQEQNRDGVPQAMPDYANAQGNAQWQQAASAGASSRQSSMLGAGSAAAASHASQMRREQQHMSPRQPPGGMYTPEGYPTGPEASSEVPRSRPGTSSTLRHQQAPSRTPPPAMNPAPAPGQGVSRASFSSHHSVLSAGSYQAAAAAAAAAVVAANARSRGLSPGRGGTLQEVERNYVAAAASAAVNRAMNRAPSPRMLQAGLERELLQPNSRAASPGREMRNPGIEPAPYAAPHEAAAAWSPGRAASPHRMSPDYMPGQQHGNGPYHAANAAPGSDISSASRASYPHSGPQQLPGAAKFPGAGNSCPSGLMRPMPAAAAAYGTAAGSQNSGGPGPGTQGWGPGVIPAGMEHSQQPWGGEVMGSMPMELPAQYREPGGSTGHGMPSSLRPHPADVYMQQQQQQQQQQQVYGSGNGRRAHGHYRSSSDGGTLGTASMASAGQYDHHRPSSDSRLKSKNIQKQEEQQWQQQQQRQQQQQQYEATEARSSSSDEEEPARWHQTLERLKHQQQQQQQPRNAGSRDWQPAEEDAQSDDEMLSTAPVRYVNAVQAPQEHKHRHSPSPGIPSEEGLGLRTNSRGAPQASKPPREQCSPTPGSTAVSQEDRRGSKHSSCAGSRVSAVTATTASTAPRAKYQPYPGQAALVYNPKTAPKTTSYLHGDRQASGRSSPSHEPAPRSPEPESPPGEQEEEDLEAAAAEAAAAAAAAADRAEAAERAAAAAAAAVAAAAAAAAAQQAPAPAPASISPTPEQRAREFKHDIPVRRSSETAHAHRHGRGRSGGGVGGGVPNSNAKHQQLEVRVSASGSDNSNEPHRSSCCGLSKRAVWCAATILLLVVMAGAGVGVGVAFAKGKPAKAATQGAAAAADLSTSMFAVGTRPALTGTTSDQRCRTWFGSPEKLQQYQTMFGSAYAQALSIPAANVHVLGISCDGLNMFTRSTGPGASRSLLAASTAQQLPGGDASGAADPLLTALLGQQQGSGSRADPSSGMSEVVTRFSVTAATEPSTLSSITSKVTSWSANILAIPLAQFYQSPVQVQPAAQLEGWQAVAPPAQPAVMPGPVSGSTVAAAQPVGQVPQQQQQQFNAPAPAPVALAPAPAQQQQQGQGTPAVDSSGSTVQAPAAPPMQPAPAKQPSVAVAAGEEVLDEDEEPEEPVMKAPKARAPAAQNKKVGKKPGKKAGKPASNQNDDYYPIDSEDAAIQSSDNYEGLDPDEMPIEPPPPTAAPTSLAGTVDASTADSDGSQWVEFYDNAPTCAGVPTIVNSVYDGSGRLWGWEKRAMCVFRATSPQWAPVTWKEAKACSGAPTATSSVYDESGKLWGFQDGANCAFKAEGKLPPQLAWKTAPACSGQPSSNNSVSDLVGKKWGWSNGKTCAFRQGSKA